MTKQEKRIFKAHLKRNAGDITLRTITAILSITLGVDYILLGSIVLGVCWVLLGVIHVITVAIYFKDAFSETKNIMILFDDMEGKKDEQLSNIFRY